MSENRTQTLLNNYFEKLNIDIHPQEGNKEIFGSLKPDGYFIDPINARLFIIEAKRVKSQFEKEAKQQLQKYIEVATFYADSNNLTIIPIFVYGTTKTTFKLLYVEDFDQSNFKEFKEIYKSSKMKQLASKPDKFNPHIFNQWIYDNFSAISSNERLLIVVGVILTKYIKSDVELKPPYFIHVLEIEKMYGMNKYFEFIKQEPYISCVNAMFDYLTNIPKDEIVNHIYSCFVEISLWSFKNSQGSKTRKALTQTEGAVLTPPDIVNLMINELDIKPNEVVCDPCCGTANFLISVLSKTNLIIGNELDITRYIITKHGLIISGIEKLNDITNSDCMDSKYLPKFDWLLMNPPYGGKSQQKFTIKFIELARKGGAVIIPINDFQQEAFQSKLKEICVLEKLIVCSDNVFYPINSVRPAILIFSKSKKVSKFQLFDFRDDGSENRRGNIRERVIVDNTKKPIFNKDIKDEIWRFSIPVNYYTKEFKQARIDNCYDYMCSCFKLGLNNLLVQSNSSVNPFSSLIGLSFQVSNDVDNINNVDISINQTNNKIKYNMTEFSIIGELFKYISHGKTKNITQQESGCYPLISSCDSTNGIYNFINKCDYEGVYVTVASNGSVGASFVQQGKFAASGDVTILKPIITEDIAILQFITFMMTIYFKQNYSWGVKLKKSYLEMETIELPTIDSKITIESINSFLYDVMNSVEK